MSRNWWLPMLIVLIAGAAGVMFIGVQTYREAPPIPDFVDETGTVLISRADILRGQATFQRYALMDYGSMFGDGASRGPDFTADALHLMAMGMREYYAEEGQRNASIDSLSRSDAAIAAFVQSEIKKNRYDETTNQVTVGAAQSRGITTIAEHYDAFFTEGGPEDFSPVGYIQSVDEIRDLASFFTWGAWVCGTERPGTGYSYTHNWPYDETVGNRPSAPVTLWSVIGVLGLMLGLGVVLYGYGRSDKMLGLGSERPRAMLTPDDVAHFRPSTTQRATYKYFAVAAILFLVQVLAGVLTVHDFIGFTTFVGYDLAKALPITVVRGWHVQLSILWISTCWIGASIFLLPTFVRSEPSGQLRLVNLLFWLLVLVVAGSFVGTVAGPMGMLGDWWYILGNQGWEFVELGKLWQGLLFGALILWGVIVWRGVGPAIRNAPPWSLPHWLLYSTIGINVLFISGFVATPETNFVIADFWRWMVIHMWVEAFFEVFTTIIVAYFMYMMGLVTSKSAVRAVYWATILFLGSGLLGISHNFYWNAKPVFSLAVGSVFSTLQVVPLILLTLDAWKLRRMPADVARRSGAVGNARIRFGQNEAFLFLLGVNFWNFFGAGVFGFIINLPIVNYYEHGTYLTVNHGHSALMGVYGNLSLCAIVFCCRFLISPERWNTRLVRAAFWSINAGLALMVLLDLFPVGIHHLVTVLEKGLWYARSTTYINSTPFQTMTWMRVIGGSLFLLGGVIPFAWLMITRAGALKARTAKTEVEAETGMPIGALIASEHMATDSVDA